MAQGNISKIQRIVNGRRINKFGCFASPDSVDLDQTSWQETLSAEYWKPTANWMLQA
jgi:hypothetical protein